MIPSKWPIGIKINNGRGTIPGITVHTNVMIMIFSETNIALKIACLQNVGIPVS